MADRVRVGVLVSGRGTNMVALSEYKRREARSYDLALVASNVPEARGLVVARRLGIPVWAHSHKGMEREEFDHLLDLALREADVEVVALAGYMRLLSSEFIAKWEGPDPQHPPFPSARLQGPRHAPAGAGGGRDLGRLLGPPRHRRARRRPGAGPGQGEGAGAGDGGAAGGAGAQGGAPALSGDARRLCRPPPAAS